MQCVISRYSSCVSLCLLVFIFWAVTSSAYASDMSVWSSLKSGHHFALVRHAIAPGMGDPENFLVDKCTTQRNLSGQGRRQAKIIGEKFRENGIDQAAVFSSQWCRCLETATLTELGAVRELPILNSFFREYTREKTQTDKLIKWLSQQDLTAPTLLFTHQVNITALTNVYPDSGEMIVVRLNKDGSLTVTGRLTFES